MNIMNTIINTPIGDMFATSENGVLTSVKFTQHMTANDNAKCEVLELLRTELQDYFAGKLFEFKSKFMPRAAKFNNQVWDEVTKTPFGTTRSYSDIALALGNPKAVRAVGNANATNCCLIIMPCHRIIAKSGSLSGFAAGTHRKEWLLAHERRVLRNN